MNSTSNSQNVRLASTQLYEGKSYTRVELNHQFGIDNDNANASVLRPSGYDSIWLFITNGSTSNRQFQNQILDENTVLWSGHLTRYDQLIMTHGSRGLELLIFHRESPAEYPGAGFEYLGCFEYQSHLGNSPTLFTLIRSGTTTTIEEIQKQQDQREDFNPATINEGREWVLSNIVRRRGQGTFRRSLLDAYGSICPITGCRFEPLLEAAHIIPYLGVITNHVQNGMPLRADVHTLFDLQLLAIDPVKLTVLLSPSLMNTEYSILLHSPIGLPAQTKHYPNREALYSHRIRCKF